MLFLSRSDVTPERNWTSEDKVKDLLPVYISSTSLSLGYCTILLLDDD
jgi:hypothetical protein